MAFITTESDKHSDNQVSIEKERILFGRHPDCDVKDVFAINDHVSRHHAQIVRIRHRYFVEDLGSANGTRLNGQRIDGSKPLRNGDVLSICGVQFVFHDREKSSNINIVEKPADDNLGKLDDGTSTIISAVKVARAGAQFAQGAILNPERKLSAIMELLRSLGKSLDVESMMEELLEGLLGIFPHAERGMVALRNTWGHIAPRAVKYRNEHERGNIRYSRTVFERVLQMKEAVLSSNAKQDARFHPSNSIIATDIRSLMCVPLLDAAQDPFGIVQLDAGAKNQFIQRDLDVIASLAPQLSIALRYAQLHKAILDRQVFERDLEVARQVQLGLLPSKSPAIADYDFYEFYRAAYQVGGDYYDYIPIPDGRVAVVVADVAGKGVSASLLMAKLAGELKASLWNAQSVTEAIGHINRNFCESATLQRFITMLVATVDVKKHEIRVVNAGHLPPLVRRDGGVVELIKMDEKAGIALGIVEDAEYEEVALSLAPGETLIMYTDGFSEAANDKGTLYGIERLKTQVAQSRAGEVGALGKSILDDVMAFSGECPQNDDMCLICVGRRMAAA